MTSKVLWALDNEISDRDFERLCTDLLAREGFHDINPVGFKKDRGRDAELRVWEGVDAKNSLILFQFSLNNRWEAKLLTDLEKVDQYGHKVDLFVFVTSQAVTGSKQDRLRDLAVKKYGFDLRFYAREWFRHRLEEYYSDLAKKYFDLDLPPTVSHIEFLLSEYADTSNYFEEIFKDVSVEQTEAHLLLKLKNKPDDTQALHALSRAYFLQCRYKEALVAINRALKTKNDGLKNLNLRLSKSIILAEYGIKERSKEILLDAKSMLADFAVQLSRDVDHYNLANVLTALQDHEEAEAHYRTALSKNSKAPQVWKNLGSLLCHMQRHQEGVDCFDKAIELRPELVEAYLCKANNLLIHQNKPKEAEVLFEYAYELKPDLDSRWPHTTYWFALCLSRVGRKKEALTMIKASLADDPGLKYLLDLKGVLLSDLWRDSEEFRDEARDYFSVRVEYDNQDHRSLCELIQILECNNADQEAWNLVENLLNWNPVGLEVLRERANLNLSTIAQGLQYPNSYKEFRDIYNLTGYVIQAHEAGIAPADNIYDVLETLLAIPFTACMECLSMIGNNPESNSDDFCRAFQMILNYCTEYMTSIGSAWIANEKCDLQEEKIDLISKGAVALPEIVLTETSRQFGYCMSFHGLDMLNLPDLTENACNNLYADVATGFMFAVCDDWGMVKDGRLQMGYEP